MRHGGGGLAEYIERVTTSLSPPRWRPECSDRQAATPSHDVRWLCERGDSARGSDLEIAHVGLYEREAREQGLNAYMRTRLTPGVKALFKRLLAWRR